MFEWYLKRTTLKPMQVNVIYFRVHFLIKRLRYTNADLKITLYICVHIKLIPRKFRIPNPKSLPVIFP